jgi:Icc-related predicted phosphoesterase
MKLYYASDIHGSETCWRKFVNSASFYRAGVIVMGGDITGKGVVPIVETAPGRWTAEYKGRHYDMSTEQELEALESRITFTGMYAHRCTEAQYEELAAAGDRETAFEAIMIETFHRWLELGEERLAKAGIDCWVMPGNDDAWAIDSAFNETGRVRNCDRRVVDLGEGYSMLSLGYANPTPWDSPREVSEERLAEMIEELVPQVPSMDRAIFNLHVPPHNSELDIAPQLDDDMRITTTGGEMNLGPVGSTAVREAIERHQPLLAVHGHIHESRNAKKIGRTLCINPGSSYSLGQLDGVIVDLKGDRVRRHQFVIG